LLGNKRAGKTVPEIYNIFLSYRRHDLSRARPLLEALTSAGLRVFRDETAIDEGASITREIREGIAASKLLVAFYSSTYPLSGACQEEIVSAWLAAQQAKELPQHRVRIINPEPAVDHIPAPLRDLKAHALPHDPAGLTMLADELRTRADSLKDGLSAAAQQVLPEYHGMAPVSAPNFVGRVHELWELHAKLTANRIGLISGVYGQSVAQVRGLGGNGKTLLAREYAIRFGPAYPGGVFWLNADGNDDSCGSLDEESRLATRQDQLRRFAVDSGVAIEGLKPEEIEAAWWCQLEARGTACLWIVDDVPSGITVSDLQRYWFARGTNASTLITTRSREYGALGQQLDLVVLSPEEAVTLLTRGHRTEDTAERAAAQQLTEALGYHPLAVEIAGSYLAKGVQSIQEYLDELSQPQHDALEYGALLKESLPTGHDRSITRTFLKSIQALEEEGKDFLRFASVLAVAPIPINFIREVFEAIGSTTGSTERSLKALDQTESLSLCENAGDNAVRIHTLISRVVRFEFRDNDRIEQLRKVAVQVLCGRLSVAEDVREHLKIANEVAHARHLTATALVTEDDATLASWIALHDYVRGNYSGARKLQEQVLKIRTRLLGEEHPETLNSMHELAGSLKAQGDLTRTRELQERVLEVRARRLGNEDRDTLMSAHNLARTLYEQGNLAVARQLQEQVLKARTHLLGKEDRDTLTSMNNLALTLHAQGDLDEAHELEKQVLKARTRLLGKEHPDTVKSMGNLAGTLKAQGDLAGAHELEKQVLEARTRLLGKEHPDTVISKNNLAMTLKAQGDLAGARQLQEEVCEAMARLLGKEHPGTLKSTHNLAGILYAQGDLAGAGKLQEEVLKARTRLLGKEHLDTLMSMHNLAGTLYAQGDLARSRQLQELVLEARTRLLGKEHPDTLTSMLNLAQTLKAQGSSASAKKPAKHVAEPHGQVKTGTKEPEHRESGTGPK
jgi:tetratricopeptide (TPR) repeat protein